MKILHTADWHIGKKLHKHDLYADFELFVEWLVECIKTHKIDLVLVSGDVFDLANPSHEAKKQYYQTLLQLKSLKVQLIITGGNHDSPSMLNAPQHLLKEMDIHVVGGMPKNASEALIPIHNQNNEIELVVAAIPYLRNADLQGLDLAENYQERLERLKQGVAFHFKQLANIAKEKTPTIPCIAMGHLFAKGVSTSESERDIQIGNQAGVEANHFDAYYKYIALGHIHQPQQVKSTIPIYYSGSPIQLSFSERKDQKRVLIIDTEKDFKIESLSIPSFRKLKKIKGNFQKVEAELLALKGESTLTDLIEIELIEENYNPELIFTLNQLIEKFNVPGIEIVKHRVYFTEIQKKLGHLSQKTQHLQELQAQEVFDKKIQELNLQEKKKELVLLAFNELLNQIEDES